MNKKQIRVLIVDDEPLARGYIRKMLNNEPEFMVIGECGTGKEAAHFIFSQNPELVFLDVQMPEIDGFTMLRNLNIERQPLIIFTTAHEKYAVKAFEIQAVDYLLKPFNSRRFHESLSRAKENLENLSESERESRRIKAVLKSLQEKPQYLERLLIKANGRFIFLSTSEIDWIKVEDKYLTLYSGKMKYLVRQQLSILKAQLDPKKFVQIHRSVIVNAGRIAEVQQMFNGEFNLILDSGIELSVSRNFKSGLFSIIGNPL